MGTSGSKHKDYSYNNAKFVHGKIHGDAVVNGPGVIYSGLFEDGVLLKGTIQRKTKMNSVDVHQYYNDYYVGKINNHTGIFARIQIPGVTSHYEMIPRFICTSVAEVYFYDVRDGSYKCITIKNINEIVEIFDLSSRITSNGIIQYFKKYSDTDIRINQVISTFILAVNHQSNHQISQFNQFNEPGSPVNEQIEGVVES